jgi:hypothetical protein
VLVDEGEGFDSVRGDDGEDVVVGVPGGGIGSRITN